jgi:hypothetical protein
MLRIAGFIAFYFSDAALIGTRVTRQRGRGALRYEEEEGKAPNNVHTELPELTQLTVQRSVALLRFISVITQHALRAFSNEIQFNCKNLTNQIIAD